MRERQEESDREETTRDGNNPGEDGKGVEDGKGSSSFSSHDAAAVGPKPNEVSTSAPPFFILSSVFSPVDPNFFFFKKST